MTTMRSLPLNAIRLGYRIARLPLRLMEDVTASEHIAVFAYRCDRVAARILRDESLLFVDPEPSAVVRLHDFRDRLRGRNDPTQ
ncbi:hypothetical protein ACFTZB_00985 [Rhodococcus sp. NPDC057014]|uniref:hypothetical protein n=1 Tax=Rhodococcus sp. NPDC057014 TaxID=3346000 RepID=UPI00363EB73E